MALYKRDRSFSVGWMLGGAVLMAITYNVGLFLSMALGVASPLGLGGVAFGCFAFGGFIIGYKSEGRTIIEAGLAAAIATGITVVFRMLALHVSLALAPVALVIAVAIPFVAGLFGGWLGERVQGDTIDS
jgi:hypothetical protein